MSDDDDRILTILAASTREDLATIRKGWRYVLDPIRATGGGSVQGASIRPETEDEVPLPMDPAIDTPVRLAFWVHAAINQWPAIVQTLQPDEKGQFRLATTETVDCSDIYAMVTLLDREADRLTSWVDGAHDYGATFATDMRRHAKAVSRVAWPPKGDRMTIGECPACGRRIRVKAPAWRKRPLHVPQPTTDPQAYPEWAWVVPDDAEYEPDRDRPITCRCGLEDTLEGWRERLAGPALLLTADRIVADVREQLGMRYTPAAVRQWARRGLVHRKGYSPHGHALYDRTQVLAALMARENQKDRAS